jgi:hypothetical protein
LVKERDAEGAARTSIVVKDARKAVDASFKLICDIINVYMALGDEANYETFARTLNEVIARYKRKHRHHVHHTRGGNGNNVGAENFQPKQENNNV